MSHDEIRNQVIGQLFGEQPWYAVRCLFRTTENRPWGPSDLEPGESAYEERITLWRATSFEEAVERAEAEAEEYANGIEDDTTEYVGFAQAFHLFRDPADGQEIFSLIRVSELDPDDYIDRFFDTGRVVPYHEGAEYCGSVLRAAQTEDSGPCVSQGGSHVLLVYSLLAGIPYFAVMGRLIAANIRRRRRD